MMEKHELLDYLAIRGRIRSDDVEHAFGASAAAAGMALLRLLRQGPVERGPQEETSRYWYSLTDRGWARRTYFRRQTESR
jgi:hypothetical protein